MEILSSLPERHWSSLAFELDYTPAVFSWFSGLQTQTRTKVGGISWVFSLQTTDHRTSQLPSLREPIPYNKLPPIHTHTHSHSHTYTHTHTLTHTHIPLVQFLWRTQIHLLECQTFKCKRLTTHVGENMEQLELSYSWRECKKTATLGRGPAALCRRHTQPHQEAAALCWSITTDSLRPHGRWPTMLLYMESSWPEYCCGLPSPTQGDLPEPGIEPVSPASPTLAGGFFTIRAPGKPS